MRTVLEILIGMMIFILGELLGVIATSMIRTSGEAEKKLEESEEQDEL